MNVIEKKKSNKQNRLLYSLSMITIIIIFLVIFLSGSFLKKQIFIDVIPRQPMNSIRGID